MNKKEWLDYVYYFRGKQQCDYWVCGMKKIGDKTISTKWKKYSEVCFPLNPDEDWKIDWVNNRSILPNELVLDIEDKNQLPGIMEKLGKERKLKDYIIYDTGSRGYHIHIFSSKPISQISKQYLCKIFGTDVLKAGDKTMIALENCLHWKSGGMKCRI